MAMRSQIETITPDTARFMLAKNTNNRGVKPTRVEKYVRDMLEGRWEENGDPIRFYADGTLADGQHRLLAVIESGMHLKTPVVYGLERDVGSTIDTGGVRTAGDVLTMFEGLDPQDATTIGSAIRIISLHDAGHHYAATGAGGRGKTNREIQNYYADHKEALHTSLQWMYERGKYKQAVIARGWQVALHYMFARANVELADTYLHQIISGHELVAGTTATHVRDALLRDMMSSTRKMSAKGKMYTIVKGFNSINLRAGIRHASNVLWQPTESKDGEGPMFVSGKVVI